MKNGFSKKNRSKKVKYGPMLCLQSRTSPVFRPPRNFCYRSRQRRRRARIATGTLTVVQHKQRIGAASVMVSAAPLPVCLAAPRPAPARLTRHSDAGPRLPAKKHTDCSRRPVLAGMPLTLSPAITHTRRCAAAVSATCGACLPLPPRSSDRLASQAAHPQCALGCVAHTHTQWALPLPQDSTRAPHGRCTPTRQRSSTSSSCPWRSPASQQG